MYFPAVPISDLSDPARYRTLPRRSHLYLGETVRFLLVLRSQTGGSASTGGRCWRELATSLRALASVCPGESRARGRYYGGEGADEEESDEDDAPGAANSAARDSHLHRGFRECKPLLIHNNSANSARDFRQASVLQVCRIIYTHDKTLHNKLINGVRINTKYNFTPSLGLYRKNYNTL